MVCGSTYEVISKENKTLKKVLSNNHSENPFRYFEYKLVDHDLMNQIN